MLQGTGRETTCACGAEKEMSDFREIAAAITTLDKFVPDESNMFYQKQVELRLLLSIARSLDALLGVPIMEGR